MAKQVAKWKPYKWVPERKKEPAHRNILASLNYIGWIGANKKPALSEAHKDIRPHNIVMKGTPLEGKREQTAFLHALFDARTPTNTKGNVRPNDLAFVAKLLAATRHYEGGSVSPRPGNIMGEKAQGSMDVPHPAFKDPRTALYRTQFGWTAAAIQNRVDEARRAGTSTAHMDIFKTHVNRRTPVEGADDDPNQVNKNAWPIGSAKLKELMKQQEEIDRSQLRGIQRFREKERQRAFGAK